MCSMCPCRKRRKARLEPNSLLARMEIGTRPSLIGFQKMPRFTLWAINIIHQAISPTASDDMGTERTPVRQWSCKASGLVHEIWSVCGQAGAPEQSPKQWFYFPNHNFFHHGFWQNRHQWTSSIWMTDTSAAGRPSKSTWMPSSPSAEFLPWCLRMPTLWKLKGRWVPMGFLVG